MTPAQPSSWTCPSLRLCDALVVYASHRATKVRAAAVDILAYVVRRESADMAQVDTVSHMDKWLALVADAEVCDAVQSQPPHGDDVINVSAPTELSSKQRGADDVINKDAEDGAIQDEDMTIRDDVINEDDVINGDDVIEAADPDGPRGVVEGAPILAMAPGDGNVPGESGDVGEEFAHDDDSAEEDFLEQSHDICPSSVIVASPDRVETKPSDAPWTLDGENSQDQERTMSTDLWDPDVLFLPPRMVDAELARLRRLWGDDTRGFWGAVLDASPVVILAAHFPFDQDSDDLMHSWQKEEQDGEVLTEADREAIAAYVRQWHAAHLALRVELTPPTPTPVPEDGRSGMDKLKTSRLLQRPSSFGMSASLTSLQAAVPTTPSFLRKPTSGSSGIKLPRTASTPPPTTALPTSSGGPGTPPTPARQMRLPTTRTTGLRTPSSRSIKQ
ncbi:hypothetical protein DYB31_012024 [Aphanomyces astaci]|uniref:Uncharacterized protein n=1 Tax=Aphanomyces astaci TaxID=112090 RepID=A0A397FH40_APHAT|nr:hypothetical protein DYB31_012024 [Aphanomyces astaci]